jgi:hypothetical protein
MTGKVQFSRFLRTFSLVSEALKIIIWHLYLITRRKKTVSWLETRKVIVRAFPLPKGKRTAKEFQRIPGSLADRSAGPDLAQRGSGSSDTHLPDPALLLFSFAVAPHLAGKQFHEYQHADIGVAHEAKPCRLPRFN